MYTVWRSLPASVAHVIVAHRGAGSRYPRINRCLQRVGGWQPSCSSQMLSAARSNSATSNSYDDGELLAALARYPVFTVSKDRVAHPKIGFKQVDGMFDWKAIASDLKTSEAEAMRRAFGPGRKSYGFIPNRVRLRGNLPQVGVLIGTEIITESEENAILEYLRRADMNWQPREFYGERANFGPSLTSQYKVSRKHKLTAIPPAFQSMRKNVLELIGASKDVNTFAMTPAARQGIVGHDDHDCFNQALIQRYRGGVSADEPFSQALPMHLDQRDDWAEIIAGVNLGEAGHIFFSGSKPNTCHSYAEMKKLAEQRQGILVQLPPRSVYVFYGFARYGMCHGVAGVDGCADDQFDRITVTWRSVKTPQNATQDPPQLLPTPGDLEAEDIALWGQHA